MTFVIPAINNGHLVAPDLNARFLALINTPNNVQVKTAGNLPLTDDAGRWDNNTVGSLKGVSYEFQASQVAWDVSGDTRVMVWHQQFNAPNRIQIDTVALNGFGMRIYSGIGSPPTDYKEYQLGGNNTPMGKAIQGIIPLSIDLNDISNEASNGTFDNTAVTSYAIFTTRLNQVSVATNFNYSTRLYVFTTTKALANTPTFSGSGSDFLDAVSLIQGSDFTDKLGNWVRRVGSVVFIDVAFRIGNNLTLTTFNDNGLTIISPVSDDANDPRNRFTTQACRVYLNLRNNVADTATFSGTYFWGTRAPWDFDQDDSAVVTFSNPTFNGMGTFTIGSSITGPATWNDVGPVIVNDTTADLDGSTFKNIAFGDHGLVLPAAMDIANMIFASYAPSSAGLTFNSGTDVDGINDEIDITAHGLTTGEPIIYDIDGGSADIGLTHEVQYWINAVTANAFSVHLTKAAAIAGTGKINLTSTGSDTQKVRPQKHAILIDTEGGYGLSNISFDGTGSGDIENQAAATSVTSASTVGATELLGDLLSGVSQSFNNVTAGELSRCELFLSKTGSPTGTIVAKLSAHSGVFGTSSIPTGTALDTSETVDVTTLSGNAVPTEFEFRGNVTMSATTDYVVTVEYDGGSSGNVVDVHHSTSSSHAGNKATQNSTTKVWTAQSAEDCAFEVWRDGIITLTLTNGTAIPSVTNTGQGAAVLVIPVDYVLDTLQAGSEVRIFRVSDGAALAGIESSGTSFTYNHNGEVVAIYTTIQKLTHVWLRHDDTLGPVDKTVTISQVPDNDYENP